MPDTAAAIEQLVTDAYAVISGPAGAERDWAAMRALYWPEARMTALRPTGSESCTVEEYIAGKRAFLTDNGFAERPRWSTAWRSMATLAMHGHPMMAHGPKRTAPRGRLAASIRSR